jgi:uncharacterized protein (DUF488 family)
MRNALVLDQKVSEHKDAIYNIEKTLRAIINRRYSKIKFNNKIINWSEQLYFHLNKEYTEEFLKKIIKWLLFIQENMYIDENEYDFNYQELISNPETSKKVVELFRKLLLQESVYLWKNNVAQYKYIMSEKKTPVFLISFYSGYIFFCFTTKHS